MESTANTLNKLHILSGLYRDGYQSDVIDRAIDKLVALEQVQMRQQLVEIEIRLRRLEAEYQMSSKDFHERFQKGELGDAANFFEWSAFYDMARNLRQRLDELEHG